MSKRKKHTLQHALFCLAILTCASAHSGGHETLKPAPQLRFSLVRVLPHDARHFTEGLALHDGKLLESAGRYGASALYEKDLASGRILRERRLDARYFGEGVAVAHDHIVQLTWREQVGFVYDLAFRPTGFMHYPTEGWGLTSSSDGRQLVMSDGSATLRFLDADSFQLLRAVTVHDGERQVNQLNELEAADGVIYANVWQTDLIAAIDGADGRILGWLDLSSLKSRFRKPAGWDPSEHVLNGIAYDPASGHFLVTGKCWPALFELRVEQPVR